MTDVYVLNISDLGKNIYEKFYITLPEWRRIKADACRQEKDRDLSVGAGLLFVFGCRRMGIPEDAGVDFAGQGKPYLPEYPDFQFNISHSGDMVAGIFSNNGRLAGIDIQEIRPVNFKVAEKFFHSKEREYVGESTERFHEIWALKESYLKAIGSGLTEPLKSFSVITDGEMRVDECYLRLEKMDGYMLGICSKKEKFSGKITALTLSDIENMVNYYR